jgi:hypothetical protein
MRSFLAARPKEYKRLVHKWIAIASPFGGAPGFGMDALMTGVQFCQVRPPLGCSVTYYTSLRLAHTGLLHYSDMLE